MIDAWTSKTTIIIKVYFPALLESIVIEPLFVKL